jgi:hypothetical protein
MITGNVGEWSEIYVLLKLLAEGRIYAADDNLNRINGMYFPIIKIVRQEVNSKKYEYLLNENSNLVHVFLNSN